MIPTDVLGSMNISNFTPMGFWVAIMTWLSSEGLVETQRLLLFEPSNYILCHFLRECLDSTIVTYQLHCTFAEGSGSTAVLSKVGLIVEQPWCIIVFLSTAEPTLTNA